VADPAVIQEGVRYITIFGISIPFFGLFDASAAVFRGAGHTVPPMIMAIVRLWGLRVFLSWLFGYRLEQRACWGRDVSLDAERHLAIQDRWVCFGLPRRSVG